MIKAKKSLGQNFLIDKNILEKITTITDIKDKIILEIGPGTGNLTSYILKKNPKISCVVGLTSEAERLVDIRKNRMNTLKETENIHYIDIEKIQKEIDDAKKTFKKYNWPTIDVTRKSVEETAASIIKIYEIYKK